jgi:ribosomal-protein-alanine N-acetyltransferase
MAAMRVIIAPGITLEPQFESHAPALFEVLSDPAIYEFENEPPASVAALRTRLRRLESRVSPDGSQQWLNWVVRLHSGDVAGYVQATVHADRRAALAYMLGSRWWGKSIASRSVRAMIGELRARHGVRDCFAVLKGANTRSLRLLQRLGLKPVAAHELGIELEPGELAMLLPAKANPSSR